MRSYVGTEAEQVQFAAMGAAAKHRCSRCGKTKPLAQFSRRKDRGGRPHSWCRACQRVEAAEYRQTEAYRAYRARRAADPEVQARQREREASRDRDRKRAARRAYYATPRGQVVNCRAQARRKLRRATDPARIAALAALIAAYDAELERLAEL